MKEVFYLKHDYNSRNDEKILKLRRKYPDGSGYSIYWMLLEKLGESSEGRLRLNDIENIAYDLHFPCERIADVLNQYMLFENDEVFFWSNRLLSDLAERNEKSKQGKLAAKIRWDKERKKMQTHCISNATAMQGEERRGEKGEEGKTTTTAKKIYKILEFKNNQLIGKIEDLIEKYPKKDLELVAIKVIGKMPSAPQDQKWFTFTKWCESEFEKKEKPKSKLKFLN